MSVAKRAQAYPQTSAAAGDLVDVAVAAAPAGSTVGAALKLVDQLRELLKDPA